MKIMGRTFNFKKLPRDLQEKWLQLRGAQKELAKLRRLIAIKKREAA